MPHLITVSAATNHVASLKFLEESEAAGRLQYLQVSFNLKADLNFRNRSVEIGCELKQSHRYRPHSPTPTHLVELERKLDPIDGQLWRT